MSKALVNAKQVLQPHSGDERPADAVLTSWETMGDPLPWWKETRPWLLSVVFHATVLVGLSLAVPVSLRGVSLEPGRGGGIVLARGDDAETEYFSGGSAAAAKSVDQPDSEATMQGRSPAVSKFRWICRVLCPPPPRRLQAPE